MAGTVMSLLEDGLKHPVIVIKSNYHSLEWPLQSIPENMIKIRISKCQSVYLKLFFKTTNKSHVYRINYISWAKSHHHISPCNMFAPKCLQTRCVPLKKIRFFSPPLVGSISRNGCTSDGWDPRSCDLLVMSGMFGYSQRKTGRLGFKPPQKNYVAWLGPTSLHSLLLLLIIH